MTCHALLIITLSLFGTVDVQNFLTFAVPWMTNNRTITAVNMRGRRCSCPDARNTMHIFFSCLNVHEGAAWDCSMVIGTSLDCDLAGGRLAAWSWLWCMLRCDCLIIILYCAWHCPLAGRDDMDARANFYKSKGSHQFSLQERVGLLHCFSWVSF